MDPEEPLDPQIQVRESAIAMTADGENQAKAIRERKLEIKFPHAKLVRCDVIDDVVCE